MIEQVRLGEILSLQRDEVPLEPHQTYRTAGIYSFGRGVFERGAITGAETSYKSLFRIHTGQFIVSRLNGWEGAIDVVQPDVDGCLVSNEYPTFDIDRQRAEPQYLYWICRWPHFWELLVPRGSMVRRKRVRPAQLCEVEIPLPPIDEQRRVAQRLDRFAKHHQALAHLRARSTPPRDVVPAAARARFVSPEGLRDSQRFQCMPALLGDLADFVNGTSYDRAQLDDNGEPIIRISNISDPSSPYIRTRQTFDERFLVNEGDLLVSWSASFKSIIWPGPRGILNQHIFNVKERGDVDRSFLRHLIEAVFTEMRKQAVGMGMMHLRRDAFLSQPVLVPDPAAQREIAEGLDRIEQGTRAIAECQRHADVLAAALRTSTFNHAFAGLR